MLQAGIPVEYHVFPGAYHCFELGTPEAASSKMAYELTYAALNRAFYK
jgi:acetyl esterase/lipase